jgi:ribosomal protein S12 methylthiotransferase
LGPILRVCIISLGCPKNLVDSEVIAGQLAQGGLELVLAPEEADAAVINTCGFVESARMESLDTIQEICRLKAKGRLSLVVAVGCMVQRFKSRMEAELEGVDAFLPISDYSGLPSVLQKLRTGKSGSIPMGAGGAPRAADTDLGRLLLTYPHVSYLRVAEGCNHRCSFCAIPSIRGKLKSKPLDVLVEETKGLVSLGVKEINLVAEDTTDYGRDLGGKPLLTELLRRMSRVKGLQWIRILYAYPSRVTEALVEEMARNPKVVNYIDMPVQHISAPILKSMRRGTSPEQIRGVVKRLREGVPGITLRTSVIVGYPGETEEAFRELYHFVETERFERLGAFLFSPEEKTGAHGLPDPVPPAVAEERLGKIMALQESIIREHNKSLVGTVKDIIVDLADHGGFALARTRGDAPEIDCMVRLHSGKKLKQGAILKALITGYEGYDLLARPAPGTKIPRR